MYTGQSETAAPHPYRWLLHCFTISYFTMSFLVRFTWPPLISAAAPELGISMAAAGAYMSAFFMGYVITQIPGGLLGDRFGARTVIAAALVLEGMGSLGVSLAEEYATGFFCRFFSGLGGGMVFASCVRYTARIFPKRELGPAFGLMMAAPSGVGVIVPNLLIPWLASHWGWRGAFAIVSGIAFCMGLVAFSLVRDAPERHARGRSFQQLGAVLRERNLMFLGLAGFWLIWTTVCFITWGNAHIENLGFDRFDASRVMLSFGLGGLIGSPLGGCIASRTPSLKWGLAAMFLMIPPCLWLFGEARTLAALAATAAAAGIAVGLANPFTPLLTSLYADKNSLATAGGVTGCLYQLGAVIGPWLLGVSIDFSGGYSLAWAILAVAPFMGILCLLPLQEARRRQEDERL